MVPLLTTFSAMTLQYNGSSNGQSFNGTSSYNVVYASASTIKVNVNYNAGSQSEALTAWILRSNGTFIAVDTSGTNITGIAGQGIAEGTFAGFIIEIESGQSLSSLTSTSQFHSTGTSTVTLGPTKMTVTNYAANAFPMTVTTCTGSTSLTAFSLSAGTPPGTSFQLITSFREAGSSTFSGQTSSVNYVLAVTSVTVG